MNVKDEEKGVLYYCLDIKIKNAESLNSFKKTLGIIFF